VKKFNPPCHVPVTLPHEICKECFERLVNNIVQGDQMLHFAFFICIFILIPLTNGLNLSLSLVIRLGWKKNKAEFWTTERDDKMAPNLDKVEVLPCRWLNR
jgi:hypothetical protein